MRVEYLLLVFYGFIAGVLAKALFFRKDEGSIFFTAIIGVIGSIIGGGVFKILGFEVQKGLTLSGLIPAIIGVGFLFLIESIFKKMLRK